MITSTIYILFLLLNLNKAKKSIRKRKQQLFSHLLSINKQKQLVSYLLKNPNIKQFLSLFSGIPEIRSSE